MIHYKRDLLIGLGAFAVMGLIAYGIFNLFYAPAHLYDYYPTDADASAWYVGG